MKNFSLSLFIIFTFLLFLLPRSLMAQEGISCSNRYAILVNPVRGRDLWIDKTINPLKNQYELAKQYGVPVTWLLQYDVLEDEKLLSEIKKFNSIQELGVFLEVSQSYAEQARVIYPYAVPWFSPQAVFLSGYSQSERRRLIDKLFTEFKSKFSFYPKSVGAWWIDSYSLNYMKEKYNIKSAMIVADQKTTDNYGVWGQWWSVPYYPAKANVLTPADSLENKLNVVIIQWAQRDPLLAFGGGPAYSNYSLQANDYIRQKKDTGYFNQLANVYLDCKNPLGQITVGLETGIESVGYLEEYKNQLEDLKKKNGLVYVTMSDFADRFASVFAELPKQYMIRHQNSVWDLDPQKRANQLLGDVIYYDQEISFADYFVKDTAKFLDRRLQKESIQKNIRWFPWFLLTSLMLLIFAYRQKLTIVWMVSMLFVLGAYGPILRSYYQMGWRIYFGPQLHYLEIFQSMLILVSFGTIWFISRLGIMKRSVLSLWVLAFIFGLDFFVQAVRASFISGRYYVGFAIDALRFVGLSFKPVTSINLINQDFPSYLSAAFLRINLDSMWGSWIKALLVYPLVHIILGLVLAVLLIKLPSSLQRLIVIILLALFILQTANIFRADPYQVSPILLQ